MDIVERLRYASASEALALCNEAADFIEELRMALVQYKDDLNYPPVKDNLHHRQQMIEHLMVRT